MFKTIWDNLLYEPLLNALAFLISVVPGGDVGLAVILLTIIVKIILFPLSQRSVESQAKMNMLAPEMNKIKESGKSKEEQARLTFDLYKKHKANPLSGCLLILIQIPIIFALYFVFYKGINLDGGTLYSFIKPPENLNMIFLGFLNLAAKSWPLAILAGVSQYLQAYFMPKPPPPSGSATPSFQESFSKSMHVQMRYVFPVVVAFIAYTISGAVALYWITSNIFSIGQQLYSNKKHASKYGEERNKELNTGTH